MSETPSSKPELRRELGLFGATMMGLGSIVGTGIFVSIGIAAGAAGPAVILAIAVAALLATCNAFSSAQLAANHPVSGGTYEYGHVYLRPWLGFSAGWMFLCAKIASAATAALGYAGYIKHSFELNVPGGSVALAVAAVVILTALILAGIRTSSWANTAIVALTLTSLAVFVVAGLPASLRNGPSHLLPFFFSPTGKHPLAGFLEACALMFVAYTGYGRIATLGEEVRDPRRLIPRAIILTLIISALLYGAVGMVAIASHGAGPLSASTEAHAAPLEIASRGFGIPAVPKIVALGAITAMLGVLLNLILGLSRVVLAMARRGDLPEVFARVSPKGSPVPATLLVASLIGALALLGTVKLAWSFSAFTVLVYYAITNLAALRLKPDQRLFSPLWAVIGLIGCLFMAFWVEPHAWRAGGAVLLAGLTLRLIFRRAGLRGVPLH